MTFENEDILKEARLRFSTDHKSGFTRKVYKDHFDYFDIDGEKITDENIIDIFKLPDLMIADANNIAITRTG
jgi:hypothetical protein